MWPGDQRLFKRASNRSLPKSTCGRSQGSHPGIAPTTCSTRACRLGDYRVCQSGASELSRQGDGSLTCSACPRGDKLVSHSHCLPCKEPGVSCHPTSAHSSVSLGLPSFQASLGSMPLLLSLRAAREPQAAGQLRQRFSGCVFTD